MKLERFVLISFVVVIVVMWLSACGGDSDSIMDPEPQYEMMEYTVEGRVTLQSNPTEGLAGVSIGVSGRGIESTDPVRATSDATGTFRLTFTGRARPSACYTVTGPDGATDVRGFFLSAYKEGYTLQRSEVECGVAVKRWYPRLNEERDTGGCFIVCDPIS